MIINCPLILTTPVAIPLSALLIVLSGLIISVQDTLCTLARQLAQMQAQMARLTGRLEAQEQPAPPKLSGPAEELSTASMARAMKTQKGEMR